MYNRNPVIINFDLSSHKGLSNVSALYAFVCIL